MWVNSACCGTFHHYFVCFKIQTVWRLKIGVWARIQIWRHLFLTRLNFNSTRTAVYMRTYLILYFKDLYLRLFEFRLFFLRSTNFACKNEFPLLCRGISSECKSLLSKPYWTFYSVTIDRLLKKSCLVSCEHGKYRLISVALALPERC